MGVANTAPLIDIVVPVYNEGENILRLLKAFRAEIKTPYRLLVCYDHAEDSTLAALKLPSSVDEQVVLVKNKFRGAHGAIRSGFQASTAAMVITYMADDDYNAGLIDRMVEMCQAGNDLVAPSRFIPGGVFEGCRWPKSFLVQAASMSLYYLARVPIHDVTNGFRLFSRRLLSTFVLQSTEGFTYSIELLVKCHRLGWKMAELPAAWYERTYGHSRFKVF